MFVVIKKDKNGLKVENANRYYLHVDQVTELMCELISDGYELAFVQDKAVLTKQTSDMRYTVYVIEGLSEGGLS